LGSTLKTAASLGYDSQSSGSAARPQTLTVDAAFVDDPYDVGAHRADLKPNPGQVFFTIDPRHAGGVAKNSACIIEKPKCSPL
jgi:hypothetical protein